MNLFYGAFFLHHKPEQLVESLLDNLTTGRIEIDMIEFSGIEFRHVDNRVMGLKLVQLGLSGAAMFGPNREVLQPSEVLYKKAVLVERGSFRPVDQRQHRHDRECAQAKFKADPAVADKPVVPLMEITMRNLLAGGSEVDRAISSRARICLRACGKTVLISDYFEYYRLAAYLAWRTKRTHRHRHGCAEPLRACSTKNITRSFPAGFSRASAVSLKTTSNFTSIRPAANRGAFANRQYTGGPARVEHALRLSCPTGQLRASR